MKIIYIGNPIVEDEYNKLNDKKFISYADNRVQLSFIKGLKKYYKDNVVVLTPSRTPKEIDIKKAKTIYYKCNTRNSIFYYLSVMMNLKKSLRKYLKENNNEKIVVITTGPYVYYSLPTILYKRKFKITYIPFLICAVELPEYKGIFHLISKLSKYLVKKGDASITYVANSSIDYTNKKFLTIYPTLPIIKKEKTEINLDKYREKNSRVFLFTGSLTTINGIENLLKVFEKLPQNYKLIICGDGPHKEKVLNATKKYPQKIIYIGSVSHSESISLQRNSDFLINLRNDTYDIYKYYSKYAFPSKLIEYLGSGTPVITNYMESIPTELIEYYNVVDDSSIETIKKDIINIVEKVDYNVLMKKSDVGKRFIIENANEEIQNKKIYEFINTIVKENDI